MKLSKLILPVALLFSLTGCGNSEVPPAEGGNVPDGGKEVTNKEEAEKALEELVEKSNASIKDNDAFGFTLTNKGIALNASATRFGFNAGVGEFTLNGGAQGLYSGTKETTKAGATFSGTKFTYKLDATPEEGEATHIDKNYEIGAINSYFDNGNLYIDASEAGLGALVKNIVTDAAPAITLVAEQYLGPEGASGVTAVLTTLVSSEAAVNAFIGGTFFGKTLGFNYKMAFKDIVKEDAYPLIKLDDTTTKTAQDIVTEMKEGFEETTGYAWDDVMKIYTYKNGGKALQFELTKEQIIAMIEPEDIVQYGVEFEAASVKGAIYFDDKGIPTSASLKEELKGSASADMFVNAMGSALSFDSNAEIDANLSFGSNPVSFPANYNDYNAFKMPDLSGLIEE